MTKRERLSGEREREFRRERKREERMREKERERKRDVCHFSVRPRYNCCPWCVCARACV